MNLCLNNKTTIITPHGNAEVDQITRGVRQGCPLSPTLFILFLNPLLTFIEDANLGYNLTSCRLPGGAFADDIVLTAGSINNLQQMFNYCDSFFTYYNLDMAIDGRDKTVYTTNKPGNAFIHKSKNKFIHTIKQGESYKYLGVWVNLDLNWDKQITMSHRQLMKHLAYL